MPGMNGGGFRHGGPSRPRKPRPFEHRFPCSLEDFYKGANKKIKLTRNVQGTQREEVLEIPIKAGWKKGTKLTYEGKGDEPSPGLAGDVIIVLDEKPHPTFTRDGNDLVVRQQIGLKQALCGFAFNVTSLDGRQVRVEVKDVVTPDYVKVIPNEGMPIAKSNGTQKGAMKLKFDVAFPHHLTAEQKAALKGIL